MIKNHSKVKIFTCISALIFTFAFTAMSQDALKWHKYELVFTSSMDYENPLQEVRSMEVTFTSPTGEQKTINGFWDGGRTWRARLMPWETGTWSYQTACSDTKNTGLNGITGRFTCKPSDNRHDIYTRGPVINPPGTFLKSNHIYT